jgi:hypothetical protein
MKKLKSQKITIDQIMTMERKVRRDIDIENGFKPFSAKVHKSKKSYNRTENKKIEY